MKLRYKILLIGIIWAITYPLGCVVYPYWGTYHLSQIIKHNVLERWCQYLRHPVGYSLLGYFFGWLIMPLAILDEPIQLFVKNKEFSAIQMAWNMVGGLSGICISRFIKLSFINPFKQNRKGGVQQDKCECNTCMYYKRSLKY